MDGRDWRWVNGVGGDERIHSRTICAISREYSGFLFVDSLSFYKLFLPFPVPPDSSKTAERSLIPASPAGGSYAQDSVPAES